MRKCWQFVRERDKQIRIPFSLLTFMYKQCVIMKNALTNIFVKGPAEERLRVRDLLATLKTCS